MYNYNYVYADAERKSERRASIHGVNVMRNAFISVKRSSCNVIYFLRATQRTPKINDAKTSTTQIN